MSRLVRATFLIIVTSVLLPHLSSAQGQGVDPSKCYSKDLLTIEEQNRDMRTAIALLDMVDSSNFVQAKHQFGAEFSYFGIGGDTSYDDFTTRLDQLKKTYYFSGNYSDVNGIRRQFFSKDALATVDKCIAALLANSPIGLNYDVYSPDPDTVNLTVYYKTAPGGAKVSVDSSTLVNGVVAGAKAGQLIPLPSNFSVNSSKTFTIRREKSSAVVSGSINAGPYSMQFGVPPSAPITAQPRPGTIVQTVVRPLTVTSLCEVPDDIPCAMGSAAVSPLLANSEFMVTASIYCELKTGHPAGGFDPHLYASITLKRNGNGNGLGTAAVWCSYCANRKNDHPDTPKPYVTDQLWAPFVIHANDSPGVASGTLVTYDLIGLTRTGTRLECMNQAGGQKGIFSSKEYGLVTILEVAK